MLFAFGCTFVGARNATVTSTGGNCNRARTNRGRFGRPRACSSLSMFLCCVWMLMSPHDCRPKPPPRRRFDVQFGVQQTIACLCLVEYADVDRTSTHSHWHTFYAHKYFNTNHLECILCICSQVEECRYCGCICMHAQV